MREHLPQEDPKGPHIRLGGEFILQNGFWGHPAEWDPGLAEMIVLTAQGEAWKSQACTGGAHSF